MKPSFSQKPNLSIKHIHQSPKNLKKTTRMSNESHSISPSPADKTLQPFSQNLPPTLKSIDNLKLPPEIFTRVTRKIDENPTLISS
jgi:hypothetical protein